MGQYYRPTVSIKAKKNEVVWHFRSFDYNEGQKLMEHSFFQNMLVGAVEKFLAENKGNKPRCAWMGDYGGEISMGDTKVQYGSGEKMKEPITIDVEGFERATMYGYLINVSKHEYIDISRYLTDCGKDGEDIYDIIHPLPILTAVGNGRGGGDYEGICMEYVGVWAGDIIIPTNDKDKIIKGKNYKEITPRFIEKY